MGEWRGVSKLLYVALTYSGLLLCSLKPMKAANTSVIVRAGFWFFFTTAFLPLHFVKQTKQL